MNAPIHGGESSLAILARHLPLDCIAPDADQPRRQFDEEALAQLAESIKAHGVIQPIVVRGAGADRYEIIAGERRYRASQLAGRETIPALIRDDLADQDVSVLQVLENLQRADLTLPETAAGVAKLVDAIGNAETARQLGKSEGWVSKHATLGKMPTLVNDLIEAGKIESADIAHDLAQLIKVAGAEAWYVQSLLRQAEDDKLTRAEVRDNLQRAKEQREREKKREADREERAAADKAKLQDPATQQRLEAMQRQQAEERAQLEQRNAKIEALESPAYAFCRDWMQKLSDKLSLSVPDTDVEEEELFIEPMLQRYSWNQDLQIPDSIGGATFRLSIELPHGAMKRLVEHLFAGGGAAQASTTPTLASFIAECLDRSNPSARVKAADVYAAYTLWCATDGSEPIAFTDNRWGEAFKTAGINKHRLKTGVHYLGVQLA